jgi:hypothetical protein
MLPLRAAGFADFSPFVRLSRLFHVVAPGLELRAAPVPFEVRGELPLLCVPSLERALLWAPPSFPLPFPFLAVL